jgi:hypothetical protein
MPIPNKVKMHTKSPTINIGFLPKYLLVIPCRNENPSKINDDIRFKYNIGQL